MACNEFCAQGTVHMALATTMFTLRGIHSEITIPEILDHFRPQYPGVELCYAGSFNLQLTAKTLAEQLGRWS